MWKDFFYYTKSERRAIYVLSILIVLLLVGIWLVPDASKSLVGENSKADSLTLKAFEQEVRSKNFVSSKSKHAAEPKEIPATLAEFDPNLADSIELSRLGLSSFVVRNILKYRQKGGHFSTVESFSRIYGMTQEQFEVLMPYIRITATKVSQPKRVDTIASSKEVVERVYKYPEGTLVDVNRADTAELKKIPGIGSGIARAIVAYRNRLGGFYSLEQLKEVNYVTPAMMKWFKLEEPAVSLLKVNELGLDKLRSHPYINFYQAKVIIEYRQKKGKITSLSQLSLYEEFTEKDLERLSAYLSFD